MGETEEELVELQSTKENQVAQSEETDIEMQTEGTLDNHPAEDLEVDEDVFLPEDGDTEDHTEDPPEDVLEEDDDGKERLIELDGKPEDAIPDEEVAGDGDEGDMDEGDNALVAEEAGEEPTTTNGKSSASDPTKRPPHGSEVFIGGVNRETTEEDLKDLCSPIGEIFEVRILKDKETGTNKGYAFVTFMNKENAEEAIAKLTNSEIKGKKVRVSHSQPKNRLFVGNVPKAWDKEELEKALIQEGPGIIGIELLKDPMAPTKNRGFAFVEYYNHACSEQARRNLSKPQFRLGSNQPTISWADPRPEPDAAAMSTVKVVYVKGIPEGVTEEQLTEIFSKHGTVTRVMMPVPKPGQPKRDYGFVHFAERSQAMKAIAGHEKYVINGKTLEVSLAKPPVEKRITPQEQYSAPHRSTPVLHPYPTGVASRSYTYAAGNPSYGAYGQSRGSHERVGAAAHTPVYGRGPAPAGMTMVPMRLPDGRVGYVFQPPGGGGASTGLPPPPYRDGVRSRLGGPAPYQQSSDVTRRYRPY